jgi:hypothetical protein
MKKLLALILVVLLSSPVVAKKPSEHSYSLIKIYTPKEGSEERTKILNGGANWDSPDVHYRPYLKVMKLRAATLMDPQIWETQDWGIAFLQYQSDQYKGKPTSIGYVLITRNEAGEWKERWSFGDSGGTKNCEVMFDHFMTAQKFMLRRGLDPKKFAPELLPLLKDVEQTMREYQGDCVGDF